MIPGWSWLTLHSPALVVAIPLLAAFATLLVNKISAKARNVFVILALLVETFVAIVLARDILLNGIKLYVFGGTGISIPLPSGYTMPIRIIYEVDAMSVCMMLVSVALALLAGIYSLAYMKNNTGLEKYYTLTFLLLAGMLGMELTGDIFNFFVFLEITSIAGCALVAFFVHKGESSEAAYKYMVVCSVGGLFVLFAAALFYSQYNGLNMAYIAKMIKFNAIDKIALALLLSALCMKAGSFPMHMWLPDAYSEAPCSITIMLIGSTLASLYGILRICFTLYSTMLNCFAVGWIIIILGLMSIFVGVTMAVVQTDIKRLLAYAAVSQIGYMLLAFGVGIAVLDTNAINTYGIRSIEGGIFHVINDALCKALLFLAAGAVIYSTHTRNLSKLTGLARNLKYTSLFFIIGALGLAGMPPCNGFVSKLIIYESVYQFSPILAIIAILASILTLAVLVKAFYSAFLGPQSEEYRNIKEVPLSMLIPMFLLASVIIIIGLFPNVVLDKLITPAAQALINRIPYLGWVP